VQIILIDVAYFFHEVCEVVYCLIITFLLLSSREPTALLQECINRIIATGHDVHFLQLVPLLFRSRSAALNKHDMTLSFTHRAEQKTHSTRVAPVQWFPTFL